jgi:hypothetical protein
MLFSVSFLLSFALTPNPSPAKLERGEDSPMLSNIINDAAPYCVLV